MTGSEKTLCINHESFDSEHTFDSTAYAEEVMKTVGADFHEDDPLFQTNEFRMHCYKILPCTKHFCHDWSVCPFAHFSERAKRRDPKDVKYTAIACPDMKKGENCPRGDRCPYSHNTFEYWLHPTRYRTRLCRDSESCNRKICFFAHKPEEVRVPSSRPSLPVAEELWTTDELGIELNNEKTSTFDVLKNTIGANPLSTVSDKLKLDQMDQIKAILENVNGPPAVATPTGMPVTSVQQQHHQSEPTFVDQMLSTLIPSSCGVPDLSFAGNHVGQNSDISQVSQNLSYNSCFQAMGLGQGADFEGIHHHPMNNPLQSCDSLQSFSLPTGSATHTQQFPVQMDPFTGLTLPQSAIPFTTGLYGSELNSDLIPRVNNNCTSTTTATKSPEELTEMLCLLSNWQLSNSPTSVLGNGMAGLNHHHAVSIDGSSISGNSGVGMTDNDLEKTPIGGNNSNTAMATPGPSYYGMMI